MIPLGDFFICTISKAFVSIAQLWPRWSAVVRCEAPFGIFCTGQAGYFLQQDVDKALSYRRTGKRKQEDAILETMSGNEVKFGKLLKYLNSW